MRRNIFMAILLISVIPLPESFGQLYINEFSSSNSSIISDPLKKEFSDWIEIYNAGKSIVNLKGYFLTDNLSNRNKWEIKIDAFLNPGQFILFWADGLDTLLHTNFKLLQEGEEIGLISPTLTILDSLAYPPQLVDITMGRTPDGNARWAFFTTPTPEASNTSTPYSGFIFHVPEFSVTGGLYNQAQNVELKTTMGGTICYTLDGSEPNASSQSYSSPIYINATSVLRARVFQPSRVPGRVITHSYFIGEDLEKRNLPVVSIATAPENFWDPTKGIYVQNFKPDWEVPINIELFENNQSDRAAFNLPAGTKVNGLYSWQLPQKMLGIYFRKQYGEASLDYNLFFDKSRTNYKDFALRASGSDWSYTMFRDILGQHAARLNTNLDIMDYRPCVVYVNGKYMGIHNIREKVDQDYIVGNYGLEPGKFDLVENEDFAEEGDLIAYNQFLAVLTKDLSIQKNFDAVAEVMDIENFTDFAITEICTRNSSIQHNIMAWKPKGLGKWKWVVMDLDRGFFAPDQYLISFYLGEDVMPLKELFKNTAYKQYFGQRLADHLFTSFNPKQISKLVDEHKKIIENEMPNHVARWLGTTSTYGNAMPSVNYWYNQVNALKTFANARPDIILNDLQKYGFSKSTKLAVSVVPANGGLLKINGFKIPETPWSGSYPMNLEIKISAIQNPGYTFAGWKITSSKILVPKKSNWKFNDTGTNLGNAWYTSTYNDASWKSGPAELGYGDGDEQTTVSYGGNTGNRHITTYFRRVFNLEQADLSSLSFYVNLIRDDGAIVYLNGIEILRSNMPPSGVDFNTKAGSAIDGIDESLNNTFEIHPSKFKLGENLLAVEIHQNSASSSDISFDLELLAEGSNSSTFISTAKDFTTKLTGPLNLVAVYTPSGDCILPDTISGNTVIGIDCKTYFAQADVTVLPGATLTINPGVVIYMPQDADFFILGKLLAKGSANEPIVFKLNPQFAGTHWGALCIFNSPDTSKIQYLTLEDASRGPGLTNSVAAISAYKANLQMDHILIDKVAGNPIAARYSNIVLTNSYLHSEITGDLINVKYGHARIENCEFFGSKKPDTDAIDYDGIDNGIIKNCKISGLFGFNSDGIDIGEKASNITIDSNLIFNITDKGISVGQQSTVHASNTTFVNCNLGLGLKDSCFALIDHCTFYNVGTPVACFEKNAGSAGGNGQVNNSILSNSIAKTYLADNHSTLAITNCLSDNDTLPMGKNNLFGNPEFENPTLFNFRLKANSAAMQKGKANIGTLFHAFTGEPSMQISGIFYNNSGLPGQAEFIALSNPSNSTVDLSGYTISGAVELLIPEKTTILPGASIFITKNKSLPTANNYPGALLEWQKGNLANEGENILLSDNNGIVVDKIHYLPTEPWPKVYAGEVLKLTDASLDNHFGESWSVVGYEKIVNLSPDSILPSYTIFPNPSTGSLNIKSTLGIKTPIKIYSLTGAIVYSGTTNESGLTNINLYHLKGGVYLLKLGQHTDKVVIMR